ncbi:MAG: hypothetical protein WD069_10060 [Planctomycetales bacterium]
MFRSREFFTGPVALGCIVAVSFAGCGGSATEQPAAGPPARPAPPPIAIRAKPVEAGPVPKMAAAARPDASQAQRAAVAALQAAGARLEKDGEDRLVGVAISPEQFAPELLDHLVRLVDLESLELRGAKLPANGFGKLQALKKLKTLDLAETGIASSQLSFIAEMQDLERLDLSGNPGVADHGLDSLRHKRSLKNLSLRRTAVTGRSSDAFASLAGLTTLHVEDSNFDDAGAKRVAALPALAELKLDRTFVTDAAVAALADAQQLRKLSICGTAVGRSAVAALRKALPETEVIAEGLVAAGPLPGWPPQIESASADEAFAEIHRTVLARIEERAARERQVDFPPGTIAARNAPPPTPALLMGNLFPAQPVSRRAFDEPRRPAAPQVPGLIGAWKLISHEAGGARGDAAGNRAERGPVEDLRFVFDLESITRQPPTGRGRRQRYRVDAETTPISIDTLEVGPDGELRLARGILDIRGDRLRLCLGGKERPLEFEAFDEEGSPRVLLTLERNRRANP